MIRISVLVSGGGSTLDNLCTRIRDGRLRGIEVSQVICSRTRVRAIDVARGHGLEPQVLRVADAPDSGAYSAGLTAAIERVAPDLVVMGGFLVFWRMPQRWLGRVVNIHPALLPAFGGKGLYGLHVHAAVLAGGVHETGCTVHLVDNEYDHGPTIAQRRVPVFPGDTATALADRVQAAERELYPWVLQQIADAGVGWLERFRVAKDLSPEAGPGG